MTYVVRDALPLGRENAVPSKVLADRLGYRSVRELQKQIETERNSGAIILSDPCGAGYFLSDDPAELRRFIATLSARSRRTQNATESARRALERLEGGGI